MPEGMPSKVKPALIGGLAMGLIAAVPLLNCLCCIWALAGGAFALYLYQKEASRPVEYGDGILVGLLTGAFGGAVKAVIAIPVSLLFGRRWVEWAREFFGSLDLPSNQLEQIDRMLDRASSQGLIAVQLFMDLIWWIVVFAIFAGIGAVIGVAIFAKRQAPPPAPPTELA